MSLKPQCKKVALITGASRGIGAATARLLAEQGCALAINYVHDERSAKAIVRELESAGIKALAIRADVAREADVMNMFLQIDEQLGTITSLVNNAGILESQSSLENFNVERLQRIFMTNVVGSFICAREAVKRMSIKNGGAGGTIVNVSSAASVLGAPNEYIDYAASKGAIDTMTIGLAKEVAGQGIRVNAVRPGLIYTDIHASGGEPDRIERLKQFVPMKRGGTSAEVAEAIIWLLSDKSSYCTGTFIDITGGR